MRETAESLLHIDQKQSDRPLMSGPSVNVKVKINKYRAVSISNNYSMTRKTVNN